MDKPPAIPPSLSTIRKPPAFITPATLMAKIDSKTAAAIFDVREPALFHPRHIAGSQNAPDSQTTALIRKLQTVDQAVLVCNDGKLSSNVARTLAFVKIHTVCYLEGGIEAWSKAGGKLFETTRSGFEHELSKPLPSFGKPKAEEPAPTRWLRSIKDSLFGDKQ